MHRRAWILVKNAARCTVSGSRSLSLDDDDDDDRDHDNDDGRSHPKCCSLVGRLRRKAALWRAGTSLRRRRPIHHNLSQRLAGRAPAASRFNHHRRPIIIIVVIIIIIIRLGPPPLAARSYRGAMGAAERAC
jgi:hypothetical protein